MIVAMLATGCASGTPATGGGASPTTGALAATSTAAATSVAAATEPATSTPAAPLNLDGTYRYTLTREDAEAAFDGEADVPGLYPQTNTVVLKDGDLEGGCFGAAGGTYEVEGDRITFHSIEYDADSTVTFTVDAGGNLELTPVPPMDPGDAFQCFSKPWTKIG
jgi:hypothetical protein